MSHVVEVIQWLVLTALVAVTMHDSIDELVLVYTATRDRGETTGGEG